MQHLFFCLALGCLSMAGCSCDTDVSNDPRFKGIVHEKVHTKQKLRLYGINYITTGSKERYDLTTIDRGELNLIAFVPVGHPVNLTRIYRHNDIGGDSELLEGQLTLKGQIYPFIFYLGSSVYPDYWRYIFDSFEARP